MQRASLTCASSFCCRISDLGFHLLSCCKEQRHNRQDQTFSAPAQSTPCSRGSFSVLGHVIHHKCLKWHEKPGPARTSARLALHTLPATERDTRALGPTAQRLPTLVIPNTAANEGPMLGGRTT